MAYFSSLVYLVAALALTPITLHPSLAFLFRAWAMPTPLDGIIMCGLGLIWAGWTYFMARAYSLAQASGGGPV